MDFSEFGSQGRPARDQKVDRKRVESWKLKKRERKVSDDLTRPVAWRIYIGGIRGVNESKKTEEYPFNPLEGLKPGEASFQLKEQALASMNEPLSKKLRCAGALDELVRQFWATKWARASSAFQR